MFSFFSKAIEKMGRFSTAAAPLKSDQLGEFLFTLHLRHVDNVLDADALWEESSYAGQENIRAVMYDPQTGAELEEQDYRLYKALQDHPRVVSVKDANGVSDQGNRVFTDVVIWVPQIHWDNDARQGGHKIYIMADRLAHAHRRDLGKDARGKAQLLDGRAPRYCIMPDPKLKRDEVVCQFGLGVFVPDHNDERNKLADFNLRKGEQGFAFQEWIFFEQGRRVMRPIGWYAGQRFLHLSQDPSYRNTCIQAPAWFSHGKGYLQLALSTSNDAESAKYQQMYADGVYVNAGKAPYDGFGDRIVCEYYGVVADTAEPEILYLEIIPDEKVSEQTEGGSAADRFTEMTIVGGAQSTGYQLNLVGFVLPKLDGQYLESGIQSWQITLDAYGRVIEPHEYTQAQWVRFLAYTDREGLFFQDSTMSAPEPFSGANEIFCGDFCYHVLPAVSLEDQHGLVHAKRLTSFNLETSAQILGRANSDFALNQLDKEGTLWRTDGRDFGRSLQNVGFSSQHAGVQLRDGQLIVRQLSKSSPIFVVDENFALKEKLAARESRELTLASQEGLIVGSYVLQFQ